MTLARIITLSLFLGLIAALIYLAIEAETYEAEGALDCSQTFALRIEIEDNGHPERNGGLLALPGAYVHLNRNPQTGALDGVDYRDNGTLDDDKARLGVIEERTACSTTTAGDYTAELRFSASLLSCDIVAGNSRTFGISDDTVITLEVDDCEAVEPTATASATPVPPTATATQTPTSTVAPAQTATATAAPATPTVPALVAPTVAFPTQSVLPRIITPPSTGDAGLLGE